MADSVLAQAASYPLAAYNFRVTLDQDTLAFARVTGLQRQHQTLTYRHGLSHFEGEQLVKFYADRWVSLTLERGATAAVGALYAWLEQQRPRTMEVHLCDAAGLPVLTWRVAKAVAVKLTAPTFDARTNEVAIESLEVKAAGITIVPH